MIKLRHMGNQLKLFCLTFFLIAVVAGCLREPDDGPPRVNILNPSNGDFVNGVVPIVASASDDKDVENIKILIDGQEVASANEDMVSYNWDTDPVADNLNHVIAAYALDEEGNIGASDLVTVRILETPLMGAVPTILFVFPDPTANNVFSKAITPTIQVVVDADDDKPLDRVDFYIDGQLMSRDSIPDPLYRYDWDITQELSEIDHTIYVVAYDTDNNSAAALAAVTIVD